MNIEEMMWVKENRSLISRFEAADAAAYKAAGRSLQLNNAQVAHLSDERRVELLAQYRDIKRRPRFCDAASYEQAVAAMEAWMSAAVEELGR